MSRQATLQYRSASHQNYHYPDRTSRPRKGKNLSSSKCNNNGSSRALAAIFAEPYKGYRPPVLSESVPWDLPPELATINDRTMSLCNESNVITHDPYHLGSMRQRKDAPGYRHSAGRRMFKQSMQKLGERPQCGEKRVQRTRNEDFKPYYHDEEPMCSSLGPNIKWCHADPTAGSSYYYSSNTISYQSCSTDSQSGDKTNKVQPNGSTTTVSRSNGNTDKLGFRTGPVDSKRKCNDRMCAEKPYRNSRTKHFSQNGCKSNSARHHSAEESVISEKNGEVNSHSAKERACTSEDSAEAGFLSSQCVPEQVAADREAQQDELVALKSIYEDDVLRINDDEFSGKFYITPEIKTPFHVVYPSENEDEAMKELVVEHLPPLELEFRLPATYPKSSPPSFTLCSKWLSLKQMETLCEKLESIWDKSQGNVVLFEWVSFLQMEALPLLGISDYLDISRIVKMYRERRRGKSQVLRKKHAVLELVDLVPYLRVFNHEKKQKEFCSEWFLCNVCFTKKQGSQCMAFSSCDHVFCCECLQQYFTLKITEGNVHSLQCPEDGCQTQAQPFEVRKLVSEEMYTRYDKLLLSASLSSMSDVIYCPRSFCQCAVVLEAGSTMAECPSCNFAFCIFCKKAYHGVDTCNIKTEEKQRVVELYLKSNREEKAQLEQRYGRLTLRMLVDETMSEKWMQSHSKKCPHCKASIEKSEGCNKMVCWRCGTIFCWLCLTQIKGGNPYLHFNDPSSPCFEQLFEGALPRDEEFLGDDEPIVVLDDDAEFD